jgi:hypothetical protein
MMRRDIRGEIVRLLMDERERTLSEVTQGMDVDEVAVDTALPCAWQKGVVFLLKKVFFEKTRLFRGSGGYPKMLEHATSISLLPTIVRRSFQRMGSSTCLIRGFDSPS